jgi:hypothetical protein
MFFVDFCTQDDPGQGQNLALDGLFVPSLLDSGLWDTMLKSGKAQGQTGGVLARRVVVVQRRWCRGVHWEERERASGPGYRREGGRLGGKPYILNPQPQTPKPKP